MLQATAVPSREGSTWMIPRAAPTPARSPTAAAGSSAASPSTETAPLPTPTPHRLVIVRSWFFFLSLTLRRHVNRKRIIFGIEAVKQSLNEFGPAFQ